MSITLKGTDAYEILQQTRLEDIHADGLYLLHKKSGARIAVISNDDPNKVFYIGFRTTPKDSTGVPHIIEHTVLCGSEKFPVKDPFIELLKGSMNTFLNAMTYPDKTVYPVASCNDQDFQNLMDVYMDAVLHPNIYQEPNIFRQEGWHYELESPEEDLTLNGVVYNEMKGAYSSGDAVLERTILNTLYPDNTYSNESGGDPDVIPELTREDYLEFHRTYYHPSNSYIYLYGDLDVSEKLIWLDREYLSKYDRTEVDSAIPMQKPFAAPVRKEISYSISSAESEEDNTYLSCSWSVGTKLDLEQYIAFDLLDYALLNSPGAPLKQALLDAGISDDIYGGYDCGVLQPYFMIAAKNANPKDEERFYQIIQDTLADQVKNGINRTTLTAAVNGDEFRFREADFGRYPKGLMFGLQMLDSWLYDDSAPFLLLQPLAVYEELRRKIPEGYFEELVKERLIDNTHCAKVTVLPKRGGAAKKEQALQEKLNAYRDSLSVGELQRLIDETAALAKYQETPSPKEELERIPLLSREDMKKTSDPYSNVQETAGGVPFVWHNYDTNGILYLDYLFDIRHIPEEKIPLVGILKTLMGSVDTEDYTYIDLVNEINLYTGGVSPEVNIYGASDGSRDFRMKFEIRIRTLDANLEKAMDLAQSMLTRTLFSDEKRIFELLAQSRSRLLLYLRESGNSAAVTRALSSYAPRSRCADLIGGIAFYRYLDELVEHYESRKEALRRDLESLVREIVQPSGLLVSVTGNESEFALVKNRAANIAEGLFADTPHTDAEIHPTGETAEGFQDASQIQYVALAGNFGEAGYPYRPALRIFRCIMNYEYLWQNIRVRGGAYGCGCGAMRTGDIYFSSYRDPHLTRTLEVYRNTVDYLRNFDVDERDMTRFIIGTFSELDTPLTPCGQGRRSLSALICGTTLEMVQEERDGILAADQQSIRDLADLVESVFAFPHVCVIGNEEKLAGEADVFDRLEPLAAD